MSNRFYAYFPPDEKGGWNEYRGRRVLFRYFEDRLQILGIDCGSIEPKDKRLRCFNWLVEEIPPMEKDDVKKKIRLGTGYKGGITLLQEEQRVSVEPAANQF